MRIIEIIQKKRDKHCLHQQDIEYVIKKYVDGLIPDYQISAFLMAIFINGLNTEELSWLTNTMLHSGEVISHKKNDIPLIDKHSTGGVGDKISIPLAPAVAVCGLHVPMIAGRGLGHTGGTLDKLESIPGFRCNLTVDEYKKQVEDIGCVIMGQTENIAPADKKLYALRDVTGTVESIPLIASSIMSKKLAEGIDGLVLDVKFGSGAFLKEIEKAKELASTMVNIGLHMGKKVTARLTNMDQPLGVMIGNALEIIESIEILQDRGPQDSTALTIELGAEMLMLGEKATSLEDGRKKIKAALSSGKAFEKFVDMVKAQGGDERFVNDPKKLYKATKKVEIKAPQKGFIESLDSRAFGLAASVLGGGRCTLADEINHAVGIEMHHKIGDLVDVGQPICTLHVADKGIDEATSRINHAIRIVSYAVKKPQLCI